MKTVFCVMTCVVVAVLSMGPVNAAQDPADIKELVDDLKRDGANEGQLRRLIKEAALRAEEEQASRQFMGFNWGLGFGVSADLGSGDRVDEAAVVDGIVRVSKQSNVLPRIILEGHHFVLHNGKGDDITKATRGSGPFVAVQSSGEDAISGFGAGWMVGFRHKSTSPTSFNVALGLIVDANVKTLGDGIVENQPLPGAETAVRFKEESRTGLLVFASFSF